ncbi:hypothetical protein D3C73_1227780 [compost metagenome]
MFFLSPIGKLLSYSALVSLFTGAVSPVNDDSCTVKLTLSHTLISAGAMSPVSSIIKSPTATLSEDIISSLELRITLAFGIDNFCSDSIDLSALPSCISPINALTKIIISIIDASVVSPNANDITPETRSIKTIKSLN